MTYDHEDHERDDQYPDPPGTVDIDCPCGFSGAAEGEVQWVNERPVGPDTTGYNAMIYTCPTCGEMYDFDQARKL